MDLSLPTCNRKGPSDELYLRRDGAGQTTDDHFQEDCQVTLLFLHGALPPPIETLAPAGQRGPLALDRRLPAHPGCWHPNKASFPFHPPASLWACEWQATGLHFQLQYSDRHTAAGKGTDLRMQTGKLQFNKLSSYPLCWGELGPIR